MQEQWYYACVVIFLQSELVKWVKGKHLTCFNESGVRIKTFMVLPLTLATVPFYWTTLKPPALLPPTNQIFWSNGKVTWSERCVNCVCIRSYSGPYFPTFGLNTERYFVPTRITPNADTFYAVIVSLCFRGSKFFSRGYFPGSKYLSRWYFFEE